LLHLRLLRPDLVVESDRSVDRQAWAGVATALS
jgi:hypothetical protein